MLEVDITLRRNAFELMLHEQFPAGITGIYGPSGAGKTSLLHVLAGLTLAEDAEISLNGKVLQSTTQNQFVKTEQRNVAYVFQDSRLFPHLSVRKNLLFGFSPKKKNKINFEEVISLLQLELLLDRKPEILSGGEKQRVALGRSLLTSPSVMLLDEPFSAVDTIHRAEIMGYLTKINDMLNIPIIVVSHNLHDLLKITDKLCIMNKGKCVGHGKYDEVQHLL